MNDIINNYTKEIKNIKSYPAEYLIRILKGQYPLWNSTELSSLTKRCLIASCGDGRHIQLVADCGFDPYITEISSEIVDEVIMHNPNLIRDITAKVGFNDLIPYEDSQFGLTIAWNNLYYIKSVEESKITDNIYQLARVTEPGGILIASIPSRQCFIYDKCEVVEGNYVRIQDWFNVRTGSIMYRFESQNEIRQHFLKFFDDIKFITQRDDCFGLDYSWDIMIGRRKLI